MVDIQSRNFKTQNFNIEPAISELVEGPLKVKFVETAVDVVLAVDDPEYIVVKNTSGGNINVDLPSSPAAGKLYKVITQDSAPNNIVVRDDLLATLGTTATAGEYVEALYDNASYIPLVAI